MPTILCLDLGTAHTGIAVSEEGILATPVATVYEKNSDQLVGRLVPFIAQFDPDTIVIGIPEYGPLRTFANEVGEKINKIFSGKIVFFKEDLSSSAARNTMKQTGKTLAKRKREEHQTAAALILQDYLDSL